MNRSPKAGDGPPPLQDFEFEVTDFASARAALEALPPGVSRLSTQQGGGYWDDRRRKLRPTDRALAGDAIAWMLSLPPSLRPRLLCERFARVGNELAAAWADPTSRTRLIDSLLDDQRGNRAGFPPEIRREIEALRKA